MSKDKIIKMIYRAASIIIVISLFTASITYASQDSSPEENMREKGKTIQVSYGDYIEKSALKNLELSFLRKDILRINKDGGTFVEWLVKNQQIVNKGDHLLAYRIPSDSIGVEESKIKLEQSLVSYEEQSEQKRLQLEEMYEQWYGMDGGSIEAHKLEININKKELEFERYQYDTEKSLEDMNEKIKELEAALEIQYIEAPYDGLISIEEWRYGSLPEGYPIDRQWDLITIHDINSAVYASKATNLNKLWYNLEVEITPTSNRSQTAGASVSGRVIGADSLYNSRVTTEMVYVRPEDVSQFTPTQTADLLAEIVRIENVILIPISAVTTASDISYVYIVDDNGDTYKQYITGRSNGREMWVYNGLEEGQKIIVAE